MIVSVSLKVIPSGATILKLSLNPTRCDLVTDPHLTLKYIALNEVSVMSAHGAIPVHTAGV